MAAITNGIEPGASSTEVAIQPPEGAESIFRLRLWNPMGRRVVLHHLADSRPFWDGQAWYKLDLQYIC